MKHTPRNSTTSLPNEKRDELLDRLDGKVEGSAVQRADRRSERRVDPRWAYRLPEITLRVEHLGGGVSHLLVCGRNLSSGGLGFLHGGYLHPGSTCQFQLMNTDGMSEVLNGHVVSCRHVDGVVHEVGVQFDHRVDPERFVAEATRSRDAAVDTIDVPRLRGRLLYVEDTHAESALMMHFLRPTGLNVVNVKTPGAALDAVKRGSFDYIFTDLHLDGEDGLDCIGKLRELRFCGPIIVVTAESDPARLKAAREAGADNQLLLPYSAESLYELLVSLQNAASGLDGGQLFSACVGDATMMPLITQFISEAKTCSERLEQALAEEQLEQARALCVQLKGSAPAYGFAPVGDAATEALRLLDNRHELDEIGSQIRRLILMCQSLAVRATDTR